MTRQANKASVNQLCELASTWSQIIRRKCRKAGSLVASGRKPLLVKLHLGRTELPERTNDSGSIQRDVTNVSVLFPQGGSALTSL